MEIRTIGIDLGKTVFHLVAVDARGKVVARKKCSRTQLLRFTSNLAPCLIGMEACAGSHFLGRALREQGHDARLMPAQYVKPYVKTNKNDYIDAEACAEAVTRPGMRFVPIKTDDRYGHDRRHCQRVSFQKGSRICRLDRRGSRRTLHWRQAEAHRDQQAGKQIPAKAFRARSACSAATPHQARSCPQSLGGTTGGAQATSTRGSRSGQQDGAHGLGGFVERRSVSTAPGGTSSGSLMACT